MKADGAIGLESLETWSVTQGVKKPLRRLLFIAPFFGGCLWTTIAADQRSDGWLIASLVLVGGFLVLTVAQLLRASHVVVRIAPDGITVRAMLGRGGHVLWSELVRVSAMSARPSGDGGRGQGVLFSRQRGRPLSIPENELACSAKELVAVVNQFWARHRQQCEDFSSPGDEKSSSCSEQPTDDQALGRTSAMRGGSGRGS